MERMERKDLDSVGRTRIRVRNPSSLSRRAPELSRSRAGLLTEGSGAVPRLPRAVARVARVRSGIAHHSGGTVGDSHPVSLLGRPVPAPGNVALESKSRGSNTASRRAASHILRIPPRRRKADVRGACPISWPWVSTHPTFPVNEVDVRRIDILRRTSRI